MICKKINNGLVEYLQQRGSGSVAELTGALVLPQNTVGCGCD
jgi:hypothetical protein